MTGSHRIKGQLSYQTPSFYALFLVIVASVALGQSSAAQQVQVVATTKTAIAARGQREAKDINYGEWKKICFKPGGTKLVCRTSIIGTFATGQIAVRVDLVERNGDLGRRLQIFCPVGMYLQNPVKLTVDQGKPYHVPYTWCLTNTCIAGTVANPRLIKEMNTGRTLRLDFVDSNLLSLTTSLPLGQFASIHKSTPAPIIEQDIDE